MLGRDMYLAQLFRSHVSREFVFIQREMTGICVLSYCNGWLRTRPFTSPPVVVSLSVTIEIPRHDN